MESDQPNLKQAMSEARDALSVKRIFGEPYERNGVVVIPAAKVAGGYGGGGGQDEGGASGSGFGLGMGGRPVGAYVMRGEQVRWKPAIDLNSVILRAQAIVIVALVVAGAFSRKRAGRSMRARRR